MSKPATRRRQVTDARNPALVMMSREPGPLREWGKFDALVYNVMSMNPAVMLVFPLMVAAAYYPRGNLALAFFICGGFCVAEAVIYAFLASSMPRSGGDYYLQSSLLSGSLGAVLNLASTVVGGAVWMAIAGWYAANFAVGPAFIVGGRLLHAELAVSIGKGIQTNVGVFLVSVAVVLWSTVVNARSGRTYLRLQFVFWMISLALTLVIVAVWLQGQGQSVPEPSWLPSVIERARALGFTTGGEELPSTIALVALAAFVLIYPAWSVHHVGEMREARHLRSQLVAMLAAEIIIICVSCGVAWYVMTHYGRTGFDASAFLFLNDRSAAPLPSVPFFWFLLNGSWRGGLEALLLVALFNSAFWMWVPDIPLASSRVLVSMSSHRMVPKWIGVRSQRRGAPVNALLAFALLSLVPSTLFAFAGSWRFMLAVTVPYLISFAVTCALAALIPYIHREFYRRSSAAKYDIVGIPLVTLLGCAFIAFSAFVVWRFAVDGSLIVGLESPTLAGIVALIYGLSTALFFVLKWLRREGGVAEIEIVYRATSEGRAAQSRSAR